MNLNPKLLKPYHHPSRPPCKFLMRTLRTQNPDSNALRAIRIKRLYLKNLINELEDDLSDFKEIIYRPFKNNKLFKTLKHAQIYSISQSYAYEALKNSKNLSRITLGIGEEGHRINNIAYFINKLPISIKAVMFRIMKEGPTVDQDIYKIAKSIRHLPKLENFYRTYDFIFDMARNHVHKELKIYSQVFRRLKKINNANYVLGPGEYSGFKKAIRQGLACPGITGLELNLSQRLCGIYPAFWEAFSTDESFDVDIQSEFGDLTEDQESAYRVWQEKMRNNDNKREEDDSDTDAETETEADRILRNVSIEFLNKCQKREEMKPFYSFGRFPDLKALRIIQLQKICPLGSYVVDGFSTLKHLETLIISITERSLNTGYIFQGLSKLPLLKVFWLKMNFIKNQEWILLQQFLKGQKDLEELTIGLHAHRTSSKSRYLQQNASIQAIIQDLEDKSSLKSLSLKADYWPLEIISKGLASLSSMINRLHTFRLQASDDTVFSQEKLRKRVEGLCNFIKNQSKSLVTLDVELPCVLEENIMTHIAEAISTLRQLRSLEICVNLTWKNGAEALQKYYQETLQRETPVDSRALLKRSKKWNPSLAKYLKKLKNLEDLTLTFDIVHQDSTAWILDLAKALPSLNKLRTVLLATHSCRLARNVESKLVSIVQELRNIRNIAIYWGVRGPDDHADSYYTLATSALEVTIDKINKEQARRCDLMF